MKQLLQFRPQFVPSAQTLDFSAMPNFALSKLYAVINVTQGVPIFIPGAAGLGYSTISGSVLTLTYNTTTHLVTDNLNVYYEALPGLDSNNPMENGGQLQKIQESLDQILVQMKISNFLYIEGMGIKVELQQIMDDINNINNSTIT